jgi:arsenate reductase
MKRVLILCTGNSARSQMAEGLLRAMDPDAEVHSAGTAPAVGVHPAAIEVMAEVGIDISRSRPKSVDEILDQSWDIVVTVCDHARETCPVFRGNVGRCIHIGFEDPAAVVGTQQEVLEAFRRVRDEIRTRFQDLAAR